MRITLPFPPSSLSAHAKGNGQWTKIADTKKFRTWARNAALAAKWRVSGEGDIAVHIRFEPPNRRGDRVNFPNRCKPIFDGIADAMKVNDSRFVPSFEFLAPRAPGQVIVEVRSL
ncbi:MAG TPA: hypothetical protein VFI87_06355 [Hyphomicrobiaceae bacterium]|nr:hypothetical protein [Hyphomicrobiaceae bacterium]